MIPHPRQRGHDDRHEGEVHVVLCFLPPRSAASLHSRDELFATAPEDPVDWAMEEASDDEDDAPMPDLIDMPPAPASAVQLGALHRSAPSGDQEKPSTKKKLHHITRPSVVSRVRCPVCLFSKCLAQAPRQ